MTTAVFTIEVDVDDDENFPNDAALAALMAELENIVALNGYSLFDSSVELVE